MILSLAAPESPLAQANTQIMTRISGSAIVKAKFDAKKYARLLAESLPAVIETEEENDRLIAVAQQLMKKGQDRTPEETRLLKLLSHLIQEFEERFYQPRTATPREVLCELMAANGLKQSDLAPIFGSKGVASEVINGKRGISKAQAKALARFFNISTASFISQVTVRHQAFSNTKGQRVKGSKKTNQIWALTL